MILSVGLSPAWQKTLVFDCFEVGQVNRATETHWTASGKVGNTAVAVQTLGEAWMQRHPEEESPKIGRALLPIAGPAYEAFKNDFKIHNVDWHPVEIESPTRVCTTIIDRATCSMTELVENADSMSTEELERFASTYEQEAAGADVVILTGSLPERTSPHYYRHLLEKSNCPAVLDFRGPGLLDTINIKHFSVTAKPNRAELAQTVGRSLDTESELLDAMRELIDRGAETVVVTDGAGPIRCLTHFEAFYAFPPTGVEVISPLGCGDTLAAGLALGISFGRSLQESVQLGVAAATENLTTLLPSRFDGEKALNRVAGIRIEPI